MTEKQMAGRGMFPALLKYWRTSRGLSQLDLSLAAEVSSRHLSFLETGRAKPSKEMVLSLASTLQVPLREQNTLLQAAGFNAAFAEPGPADILNGTMGKVIQFILSNHDPYPMVIMDWGYNVINLNKGALHLFANFPPVDLQANSTINVFESVFDPLQVRPYIVDWETTARQLIVTLHRLVLLHSHDERLGLLLEKLLSYPGVPKSWTKPDFTPNTDPTFTVRFKKENLELAFLTTITQFNAPQNITLEEIRIESYIPLDDATDLFFKQLPI